MCDIYDTDTDKNYHIGPDANGKTVVTETKIGDFVDGPDAVVPEDGVDDVGLLADHSELLDFESVIDGLVVWTHKAECRNSKAQHGCSLTTQTENNMKGLSELAITGTNVAFELSGVSIELQLVHAIATPLVTTKVADSARH